MNKVTEEERQLLAVYRSRGPDGARAVAAYEALSEAILSNVLPPEWHLGEERLATLFKVSRTPVREALMRIEAEHLARRRRGRGLVVAPVTPEEVLDVYVLREALDGTSARLAAQHASPLDLLELKGVNELMADAARAKEYDRMAQLNIDFHSTLARASHSPLLQRFVDQLHAGVRRFPSTTFSHPGRAAAALNEHHELISALEAHDKDAAERLAKHHMAKALVTRMQMFSEDVSVGSSTPSD
jgi:DNA-binding GntR family transcriptional regulator